MAGESLSPNERVREIDFGLDVLREMVVDEYEIVPKTWLIEAIDKMLDRRLELSGDNDII